jgi:hypothetical protein
VAGQLDCGRMTAETIEPQRNPGRYAQLSNANEDRIFLTFEKVCEAKS